MARDTKWIEVILGINQLVFLAKGYSFTNETIQNRIGQVSLRKSKN